MAAAHLLQTAVAVSRSVLQSMWNSAEELRERREEQAGPTVRLQASHTYSRGSEVDI